MRDGIAAEKYLTLAATEKMGIRLLRYGGIILFVMLGSLVITLPVTLRMQAVIADPLSASTNIVRNL